MIILKKLFAINNLIHDHFKDIKCLLDYFSIMVEGSYWRTIPKSTSHNDYTLFQIMVFKQKSMIVKTEKY